MSLDDNFIENVPVSDVIRAVRKNSSINQEDKKIFFAFYVVSKFTKTFIDQLDFSDFDFIYKDLFEKKYGKDNFYNHDFEVVKAKLIKYHKYILNSLFQEESLNFGNFKDNDFFSSQLNTILDIIENEDDYLFDDYMFKFIQKNEKKILQEFYSTKHTRNENLNNFLLAKNEYYKNEPGYTYTYIEVVFMILISVACSNISNYFY